MDINDLTKLADSVKLVKVNDFEYFIPQTKTIKLELNHYYIIRLHDTCFDSNSVINTNFNRGKPPKNRFYKVSILNILSNNIKIDGLAIDIDTHQDLGIMWNGWLNKNDIDVLEEIL